MALDELLTELDSLTARMADPETRLEMLAELCARRGELIARLAESGDLDEAGALRVRSIIRDGAAAESRIREWRDGLRKEAAELSRAKALTNGLGATCRPAHPSLRVDL